MRASDLNKASIFKIKLPACVQAKYDGVRGLYIKGQMYSNSSKLYNNVGHILNELKNIKLDLDGELYSHELPFNVLRGYLQRHEAPPDITKIHYYIFDCINKDPFDKRYQILKNLFEKHKFKYLHMVTCKKLDNYGKIDTILVDYVKQGYEGIIIRNWKGLYLCGKKSPDIFKSKASRTGKFEIVGYKLDIHGETVVWKLKCLHSDETFYSYALGTVQERKRLGKIAKQYLHRTALVRYFDLDKETGCVTRNPVVIKIL